MKSIYFEGDILKIGLIKVMSKFSKKAYHSKVSPIKF